MDYKVMNELLEKYWEGKSTLEEEDLLIKYFNDGQVSAEHEVYAPVFRLIGNHRQSKLPLEFEDQLQAKLQRTVQDIEPAPHQVATGRTFSLRRALSMAASFLLLVVAVYFLMPMLQGNQKTDLYSDTFETPEAAAAEIRIALGTLSEKMNESTAMVEDEMKKLDEANSLSY